MIAVVPCPARTALLRDVVQFDRNAVQPEAIESGAYYVGLEHLSGAGTILGRVTLAAGDLASAKFRFNPEHVLYGKLRPYLNKVARPDFAGVCSTDIIPIRPGPDMTRDYLYHWLRTPTIVALATSRSSGANLPRISPTVMAGFEIPLPPLVEQKRVAAILDRTEKIQLRCTGFVEIVDKLVDRRFRAISSEGQRTCKVAEIGRVQGGIQVTPRRAAFPIEVPYLRVANVFRDRLDLSEVKSIRVTQPEMDRVKLNAGDILIVEGHGNEAEIGRAAVWNGEMALCVHQNHLIRVRVDPRAAVPEYVSHAINSAESRSQIARFSGTTSGLNTISTADVKDLTIHLPTLAEQIEFGRVIQMVRRLKSLFIQRDSAARQMHKALEANCFDRRSLL